MLIVHAALVFSIRHQKLSLSELVGSMHSPHMAVAVGGLAQLLAAEFALTCDGVFHRISVRVKGLQLT